MKVKKTEQNKPKQPFINFQFPSLHLSCSASLGILSSENTGRTKGMSLLISPVTKSLLNAYCVQGTLRDEKRSKTLSFKWQKIIL